MADRRTFYSDQEVQATELNPAFAGLEDADHALVVDAAASGVWSGLDLAQQITPDMTILVRAGSAYDNTGQRIRVPTDQTLDCSVDYTTASTAVATPDYEQYLAITAKFARAESDPRTDASDATVQFLSNESFVLRVRQGIQALAPTAVKPTVPSDEVLLGHVHLIYGQTEIVDADWTLTNTAYLVRVVGGTHELRRQTYKLALSDLLGWLNDHVDGAADKHPTSDVGYRVTQVTHDAAVTSSSIDAEEVVCTYAWTGNVGDTVRLDATWVAQFPGGTSPSGYMKIKVDTTLLDSVTLAATTADDSLKPGGSQALFTATATTHTFTLVVQLHAGTSTPSMRATFGKLMIQTTTNA